MLSQCPTACTNLFHQPYWMDPIAPMLVSIDATLSPLSHTCTKLLYTLFCHSLKSYQLLRLSYYFSLCHTACTNFCHLLYLMGPIVPKLVSASVTLLPHCRTYAKLLFIALTHSQKFVQTSYITILVVTLPYACTIFFYCY